MLQEGIKKYITRTPHLSDQLYVVTNDLIETKPLAASPTGRIKTSAIVPELLCLAEI